MSERTGICLDCGQRYSDIPDSVTATRVKCSVCKGTVEIPPLATIHEASELSLAPPPAADPPAPHSELGAKPLGESPKKAERPTSSPVDREVAKPAPKAPAPPVSSTSSSKGLNPIKGKPPARPVFTPKRGGAAAKPVPTKKPFAPVSKPAPVKRPATPASKPAAVQNTASPDDGAAKKAKAADIIAKAKAKRANEAGSNSGKSKPSGADLIARLKAKKTIEPLSKKSAPVSTGGPHSTKRPSGKKAAAGARKASSKRASSRKRERDDGEEGGRSRRQAPAKSDSPMAIVIISVVGLAALAGGWYWYTNRQVDQPNSSPVEASSAETAAQPAIGEAMDDAPATGPQPLDIPAEDEAGSDESSGEEDASTSGSTDPAPIAPPVKAAGPGADFLPPAPGEAVSTQGITDFHVLDLSLVPPVEKWSECSEEEWASIQEDIALFLDDSGVQSTRAGDRLIAEGRKAYPAAVNALLAVDFSTKDGAYTGTTLNDLVYKITNSNRNFGWNNVNNFEEGSEEFLKNALFNKKIAANWQRYWYIQNWANDEKSWNAFCGLGQPEKASDEAVADDPADFFDD